MSLILEALRRSEAERRRGQTPDLLSDIVPASRAAHAGPRNRNIMAALAAASAVSLLAVAWWLRSPPQSPIIPSQRVETTAEAPSPAPSTAPPSSAIPSTIAASTAARSTVAPQARPAFQPPAPLAPPPLQPPARATTQPREIPRPAAPAMQAPQNDGQATARMGESGALSNAAPAAVEPTIPAPEAASPFASADVPLKLSDLSAEDRQQLPALKVSMHMWAPDAGNRFAIIDGTRVNEGDRIGDALIEGIQRDSVMLAWRGRHIRLPIR